MNIAVIFPNNLLELKYLQYDYKTINTFIIVEDPLYFHDTERVLNFNLLKLIYQRASMKYYESYLIDNLSTTQTIIYLDYEPNHNYWFKYIKQNFGLNNTIHITDPVDHLLKSRIQLNSTSYKQTIKYYQTSSFLNTDDDLKEYMHSIKTKKTYQYNFYIWNRKHHDIFMQNDKPLFNKYSFDKYNRKSLPNNYTPEQKLLLKPKKYTNIYYPEAIKYCEKTFKNYYPVNYTPLNIQLYPITHKDAKLHFNNFLKRKFTYFGDYEDAMDKNNIYLFHSIISPQLNNGLLTPEYCLDLIIKYYKLLKNKSENFHTVEGFVRQLNWREYSRLLYNYRYDDMKKNYFNNNKKLTIDWYNGTTGIAPLDTAIKWAFGYGYLHHIMRLMVVCNLMNLFKIHPDQAYKWFMEFSLDSYDWVMINNVYSMGMYADGGLTITKPYISSSNYVLKMSNFKKDGKWDVMWNNLYYYFIYRNYDKINGRGFMYKSQWNKKDSDEKKKIITRGKMFISSLTK
jgi:deoxyribodipyrimidine photolyase-related protein